MRLVKVVKVLVIVLVAATVLSFLVMQLWNWLMPSIFGLRTITFFQALGLLLLSKILLGGFHKHGGRSAWSRRREWKRKMKQRWDNMSPEERERFRAGMRSRWNCRPTHEGFSAEPFAQAQPTTSEGK